MPARSDAMTIDAIITRYNLPDGIMATLHGLRIVSVVQEGGGADYEQSVIHQIGEDEYRLRVSELIASMAILRQAVRGNNVNGGPNDDKAINERVTQS